MHLVWGRALVHFTAGLDCLDVWVCTLPYRLARLAAATASRAKLAGTVACVGQPCSLFCLGLLPDRTLSPTLQVHLAVCGVKNESVPPNGLLGPRIATVLRVFILVLFLRTDSRFSSRFPSHPLCCILLAVSPASFLMYSLTIQLTDSKEWV